jgi:SAM-dependent methyltransferase
MECLLCDAQIQPDHTLLEIGCGIGRDAIPLTQFLSARGSYLGVDIIRPSIDWCSENISPPFPNFRFRHYDVRDQLHNPHGTIRTTDIRLDITAASIDRVILWSVFTHMFRRDIMHYLREFRRVLRPDGLVYATCFALDEATLDHVRKTAPTPWRLTFEHERGAGCYIQNPEYPTSAVGYTSEALHSIVAEGGLAMATPVKRGNWAGLHSGAAGQDVMILRRRQETHIRRMASSLSDLARRAFLP